MAHTIRSSNAAVVHIPARSLQVGDLAQIAPDASYAGHFLLRASNAIISLTDPSLTWLIDCGLMVRRLHTGESITLTVTEKI